MEAWETGIHKQGSVSRRFGCSLATGTQDSMPPPPNALCESARSRKSQVLRTVCQFSLSEWHEQRVDFSGQRVHRCLIVWNNRTLPTCTYVPTCIVGARGR